MTEAKESWKVEDDDEDDEEGLDDTNYVQQKDAVLFAIDVSETMLATPAPVDRKNNDADCPTIAALKCAYQIMQQRIISSPKDMMGVLLFGTKNSKFQDEENSRSALAYPHCYLLSDLNIPSADDVKKLREVAGGSDEYEDILLPSMQPVSMSNVLFCANQIFTTGAPQFGSRRLFIITDKDNPHGIEKQARTQAAVRAKDLYDLGVVIELFPISHPAHDFDRTKFYDDIIYRDPTEGEETTTLQSNFSSSCKDGISLLNSLVSDINSKQVAKRALFSNLPFEIGPEFRISVKGYNILQPQKSARSCFVWEGGETAQIAVGTSKQAADNAVTVEKTEIKKAYKFGGSQVLFTPKQIKELKNFGSPVLRIIGFKPQSMLPFWASVKKSTFIYPSEEHFVGSTRVFAALWNKLLEDKLVGLGWYIARANANPLLVAILPSTEKIDEESKVQSAPAGLWLCPLPFADDIRQLGPTAKPLIASDALLDNMVPVVQQLQLPKAAYDQTKYPNPSLQWHYKVLQAMALDDEVPEKPDDKTVPKLKQIQKRAGGYIHKWQASLHKEYLLSNPVDHIKRTSEESESSKKKRVKVESSHTSLENMSHDELKSIVVHGDLGKYTVPQLKNFLSVKRLDTSGKKSELIERVELWVEER